MEKQDLSKLTQKDFINELPSMVSLMDSYRSGSNNRKPIEITLGEVAEGKWGISQDELFEKIGINPHVDTMENIFTMPQQNIRWIVPETGNLSYHIYDLREIQTPASDTVR